MAGNDIAYRTERDSLGEIEVAADRYWGAQTERSRRNFRIGIGHEMMPGEIIYAITAIKRAAAELNAQLCPDRMSSELSDVICEVCDEILAGRYDAHFPLVVWQTGSGTQTNMNVNEVIADRVNARFENRVCHPNDHVNMSQSSNDVFPSALHISAILSIEGHLIPAAEGLVHTLSRLESEYSDICKVGRTHLQDATPVTLGQEIGGWKASVVADIENIRRAVSPLRALAIGGTAVGTGLNAPDGFGDGVAQKLRELLGTDFTCAPDKFHALSSKGELAYAHSAVKVLACDLFKIANDIRFLASGPRCGIGEINIPENEPGSSIMPGKVNPTQCEAMTMVAVQIMGNDTAISFAAASGNFELNVFMPLMAYNFLQSVRLLAEAITSFDKNCVAGITPNREKMREYLDISLMNVTALTPHIGYEAAARIAHTAHADNISLRSAAIRLGLLTGEEFDRLCRPEDMV